MIENFTTGKKYQYNRKGQSISYIGTYKPIELLTGETVLGIEHSFGNFVQEKHFSGYDIVEV